MNKNALIIFVRNPILGKVKTRLAATIGNKKALEVYVHLLQHTKNITALTTATKFVFYADYINDNDVWNGYEKRLQSGNDLGERMQHAFEDLFAAGYKSICIIGSDCYELTNEIIEEAFLKLQSVHVVIGPVSDGGYYLLGCNTFIPDFFSNKQWSTTTVFADTIADVTKLSLSVQQLPLLNDIDEEKDLSNSSMAYLLDK